MKIVADLHIHSPYSRAVSKNMTLQNLDYFARLKGINVMGTGDFTHPMWIDEIQEKLEPAEAGLYILKDEYLYPESKGEKTRFMLTVEISSIYSKGGRARRIHNLIFTPTIEAALKINAELGWRGNIKSDGRPILGMDPKEIAKIIFNIEPRSAIIPAHAWTPWFSIFGSMSGFDSIEECFDEFAPQIFAIETGLSSDPAMNWRLSKLDNIALISNSDSHSLKKIGREANVFDTQLSYDGIIEAIKSHDPKKFLFTVEFFPEEGKYHYDGHRVCKYSCDPDKTNDHNNLCPRCGKKMTIGVLNRVRQLADRESGFASKNAIPFKNLIPLDEIIADVIGVGTASKKVNAEYMNLINKIGTEFSALLEASESELASASSPRIASAITMVREGKVRIEPGYDGEYGKIGIMPKEGSEEKQEGLFLTGL
ncbi:MAG TPA: endonuclease Q family protein [Candidatus Paceibacterota bacterium]